MALPIDIEFLREAFKDRRTHIALGTISQLSVAEDKSYIKAVVQLFPEKREIVSRMTWETVGSESGFFQIPKVADLVLVAFADGDFDMAFVIRRLTSYSDLIPANAILGDIVMKAEPGKTAWITGTKINLSGTDQAPTEPLVLGQVLIQAMTDLYSKLDSILQKIISGPIGVSGAPGNPAPTFPALAADLTAIKSQLESDKSKYLTDNSTNIVSQIAYTERGGA
jgi:hypothetical protein